MTGARHLVAAFAMVCAFGASARATTGTDAPPAAGGEVVVVNRARQPIEELYVSPVTSEDWGDDRLGKTALEPGRSFHIKLRAGADCRIDLQVIYEDGSREEKDGMNVCKDRQVGFDGKSAEPPVAAAAQSHRVTIVNDAGRPIQQVFVSSAAAADWGEDLLAAAISVHDRSDIMYRGGCLADLRIVFDNRGAEERRDIDFCALGGVRVAPGWVTADTLPPLAPPASTAAPTPGAPGASSSR